MGEQRCGLDDPMFLYILNRRRRKKEEEKKRGEGGTESVLFYLSVRIQRISARFVSKKASASEAKTFQ